MLAGLRRALYRLPFVAARRRHDADAAAELDAHVSLLTQRYERAGMTPPAAAVAARRQLGNLTRVREDIHDMNSMAWLDSLGQDVRVALRTLRRSPAFSAIAILTLGLGIGANTAMVSVVYAMLLKPLPYPDAAEIHSAQIVIPERRAQFSSLPASIQTFLAWREAAPAKADVAALRPWECNLTGDAEPERIGGARVSANFFSLLGTPVARGRGFVAEEEQPGRERVVVISDALWRRRYASDPALVGRSIMINGDAHVVVGIAPASLLVPTGRLLHAQLPFAPRVDIWKPIAPTPRELEGESWDHGVLIRVSEETNVERTRQQLEASLHTLIEKMAPGATTKLLVDLVPVREIYAAKVKLRLLLILGAATLLLLTACVSLANLLIARVASRADEFSTRVALGAGWTRVVRLALLEALVLTLAGGLVGVGIAYLAVRMLSDLLASGLPLLSGATLNLPLLTVGLTTSLVTAVVCGALPAWQAYRRHAATPQQHGGRTWMTRRSADGTRRALVGIEMALATALLASAALLLHSFVKVVTADRGYTIDRILTADLSLFGRRYADAGARALFYHQLIDSIRTLPGVEAAGAISDLPALAADTGASQTIFHPADTDFQSSVMSRPVAMIRGVTSGYFAASGTTLRAGRVFNAAEASATAVVSESLAARLWPGERPTDVVGRQFRQGRVEGPLITIVGIVGDARPGAVERAAPPAIYRPYSQWPSGPMTLLIRTTVDPSTLAAPLRAQIRALDPNLPILSLRTMREVVGSTVIERRLQVILTVAFAVTALLLGAVGLYGVVSYAVACRTPEIGLRLALGAPRASVMRSVFAHGLPPVLAGLVCGLASAVAAARALRSLLFGILPADPLSLGTVALLLLLTAGLACYVPARRAAAVDPVVALRHQ